MLQIQYVASNFTITDQTVHVCKLEFIVLNFQTLNKSKIGTSLCDVTMTSNSKKKMETSFLLNRIHFSTRKCMFDTFTQKCTRDYTAAYTSFFLCWRHFDVNETVYNSELVFIFC